MRNHAIANAIGKQIRLGRNRRRFSIAHCAKCLGMAQESWRKFETAEIHIRAADLLVVASILAVQPEFFFQTVKASDVARGIAGPAA